MPWPVSIRLSRVIGRKPLIEAEKWALNQFTKCKRNTPGIYEKRGDLIFFLGLNSRRFTMCFGFLPRFMPYNDPYQAVPKGPTDWFVDLLKDEGFVEVKSVK